MRLRDIARIVEGEVSAGAEVEIERLAKIEEAGSGDITFLSNPKYVKHLATTEASAVLVARDADFKELSLRKHPIHLVRVQDPYRSFLKLIDVFHPPASSLPKGIHPTACVSTTAAFGKDVAIGANVFIGDRCKIGSNVTVYPNTVLHDDVEIGDDTLLYANVTVREQCKIGKRVIVHSGTVIGSDGFGFAPKPDGTYEKIPQRGIVVVEDDVEIGANCTIDRATIGETCIKRGVKLDNLIQIAHNVVIGEDTVIAGQSGVSGSTKLGKNCVLAGQVGVVGHVQIADRTTIGAKSGIAKGIPEAGKIYFGIPAKEYHRALRTEGVIRHLPELLQELQELKARIEELERKLNSR